MCRCAEVPRGPERSREVQRGPERCRVEMQRCGIGVEMFRCRGAEVKKGAEWRLAQRGDAEMQHRCRDVEVQVQRWSGAEVRKCRDVQSRAERIC
jgi:hypothetical protein